MEERNKKDLILLAIGLTALILLVSTSSLQDEKEKENDKTIENYIQGWVVSSFTKNESFFYNETEYDVWSLVLSVKNKSRWEYKNYSVIYINNLSAPPNDVHLKLFYEESDEIFVIKRIKSLG